MQKIYIISLFSLVLLLSACSTALEHISAKSYSTRTDVFIEVKNEGPIAADYADLVIKVFVKTPLAGYYILESRRSLAGKPGYPFVFNIDGQASIWKIDGKKETTPIFDEGGKRIPDGGEGIRYVLDKKIRLKPGRHKVFFGLPNDQYIRQIEISLEKGISKLEFEPVYRRDRRRPPSFLNGISNFIVFYNGDIKL